MISVLNHSLEFESHALTRLRVGQVVIPVSKQKQIHMGEAALPVIGDARPERPSMPASLALARN